MSTAITDHFNRASNGTAPVPTQLAAQKNVAAASLSISASTGWPTATAVHFKLFRVDTAGNLVSGTLTIWKGTLSGTTISNLTYKGGDADQIYPAGSTVVVAPTSAWVDDFVAGLLIEHNQDGTHGAVTSTNPVFTTPTITSPTTKGLVDAWIGANESWTFATSTTITVPSDATTKYDKGDLIKITQSATVKYFVVTGVTSTVLTVIGINGETVANSAISANAYSKARNPHGAGGGILPYNPYKFRAYRNAAANTGNGAFAVVACDTETYDTGNNHASGVFTAPIAGFYFFAGAVSVGSDSVDTALGLHKNGTECSRGGQGTFGAISASYTVSDLLLLAATDTVDMRVFAASTKALNVGSSSQNYFSGHLVSVA